MKMPRKHLLRIVLGLAVALGAVGALGNVGCRSLSKPELEDRLRALEKNSSVGTLRRTQIELQFEGKTKSLELVYLFEQAHGKDGSAATTPVVLVHGTPSTLFSWTDLIYGGDGFEGLRESHDIYALEVIGHGIAPGDAAPYSFARCADFVTSAIRALGLERVHLVGSSYGGEFAWRAALNEPQMIASLVLIDSSGYQRRDEDWLPEEEVMRDNPLAKLGWRLNSRARIATALEPHFDTLPPGRVDEFYLVCENAQNWKAMIDLARDENGEREKEIKDIRAPTLVLWGKDDKAYQSNLYGERFAQDIPAAELIILPDTGHYPHEQRPAEVVTLLSRFLDSIEKGQ